MKTLILSSVLLFACGGSAKDELGVTTSAVMPPYVIHTTNDSKVEWLDTFVIASTGTVFFAIDTPRNEKGHHTAQVLIRYRTMPWQLFYINYAAGVTPDEGEVAAEYVEKVYRVWARIPVKGTLIQMRNYVGAWSATLYVDGDESLVSVANFTLVAS